MLSVFNQSFPKDLYANDLLIYSCLNACDIKKCHPEVSLKAHRMLFNDAEGMAISVPDLSKRLQKCCRIMKDILESGRTPKRLGMIPKGNRVSQALAEASLF